MYYVLQYTHTHTHTHTHAHTRTQFVDKVIRHSSSESACAQAVSVKVMRVLLVRSTLMALYQNSFTGHFTRQQIPLEATIINIKTGHQYFYHAGRFSLQLLQPHACQCSVRLTILNHHCLVKSQG